MDFNDLIFPSPKPSYDYTLSGLYYIEEEIQYHRSRSLIQQNELKTYDGTIKVTLNQSESTRQMSQNRQTKRIVTLLQLEENLRNGIIVYFHANAEDIGMCKSLAYLLAAELEMASICMEYPGYGIYHGQSSSDTIIKNAYQLIEHLINNLKVHESKIIIMGRSIGTSIAVEMSIRYKRIRALVLLSPFTSLCDVIKENSFNWVSKLVKERFRNLEKMHKVHCPTLFIHGINDKLISYQHSIQLMSKCSGFAHLQLFEGMTHNQFLIDLHIISPIRQFLMKIQS
ncbi:unnamed protein product (macronuclear) [Paramecium tetraurelia]|uniref:Serine aminopeptidase S33 domain-containing protein n=1 Tax=Paramecium tetraurelia TaxID=5888 RepID=A0BWE4_PARTE|nr:uncharacterized protein GSPATT00032713001 [Paramecium tetraurelia]CAK62861.1 unnamed protein product [Paramecium tetraurelia]|eukprot:XP_001430259.1 hypothetical protein (macronuclear) [Paramecium tetraurelia strain d4-2]